MHRLPSLLLVTLAALACAGNGVPPERRLPAVISYGGPDS